MFHVASHQIRELTGSGVFRPPFLWTPMFGWLLLCQFMRPFRNDSRILLKQGSKSGFSKSRWIASANICADRIFCHFVQTARTFSSALPQCPGGDLIIISATYFYFNPPPSHFCLFLKQSLWVVLIARYTAVHFHSECISDKLNVFSSLGFY